MHNPERPCQSQQTALGNRDQQLGCVRSFSFRKQGKALAYQGLNGWKVTLANILAHLILTTGEFFFFFQLPGNLTNWSKGDFTEDIFNGISC